MAFILVNKDNTVNFITDEMSEHLKIDDVDVYEVKGIPATVLQRDIPPQHCVFDRKTLMVEDERLAPNLVKDLVFESLNTTAEKSDYQRNMRKRRLVVVDRVVSNKLWFDSLSDVEKSEVLEYRQKLLDITNQPKFPNMVGWPEPPTFI